MRTQKGFSLIELLIVVAIILIIAAIAIPSLLSSRMAANEASAVGSVRSIITAETLYTTTYPGAGFAATLPALSDGGTPAACPESPTSAAACLIDTTLAAAVGPVDTGVGKSGYFFTLAADPDVGYTVLGDALKQGTSGLRHFYSDASGVIRSAPGTASIVSQPI